jgi:hypothetical protein
MNDFFLVAAGILAQLVVLIVLVVIVRWALSVDAFMKTTMTQIGLLVLLAKKSGASKEEIDEVLDKVYPKKK